MCYAGDRRFDNSNLTRSFRLVKGSTEIIFPASVGQRPGDVDCARDCESEKARGWDKKGDCDEGHWVTPLVE